MPLLARIFAIVAFFILCTPAQALTLEFGVSEGTILRSLTAQGFRDITVTYRGMTKARAEACRGGNRYKLELTPRGEVRSMGEIGKCGGGIPVRRAERILEKQGYKDVRVREADNGFAAIACRRGQRYRISMNRRGKIRNAQAIGPCGPRMSEREIAAQLRYWGYSRISVSRAGQGRFTAQACNEDRRVKLQLDRNGQIERERNIGRCDPPLHPAHIPAHLAAQGLSRIEVIDGQLPRYVARACRGNERIEIAMNRYGETVEESSIGRCAPPLTSEYLINTLRSMGYGSIRIVEEKPNGFVAEVCKDANQLELRLTIYGETIRERYLGPCPSPQIDELLAGFEARGLKRPKVFVEGCRRGQRIQIELDRYGDPVESQLRGRCR